MAVRALSASLLASAVILSLPASASASPWTVPRDKLLLSLSYDFAFATDEFLADGTHQSFPLNGKFSSSTLRLNGRYGFTSRFELGAELNVKMVTYSADPIIPTLPEGTDTVDLAGARGAIRDFSSTVLGPADLYFTGRYNFVRGVFAFANETRLKLPTGYAQPNGTFDDDGAVADDVTLGDGQTDVEDSLLFGLFVPPTKTFARADVGVRLRFGGPGHQAIGAMRVGQYVGPHIVLVAGGSGAYTVTEGEVIGQTYVSTVDDLQPEEVVIGENTLPVDLRQDKDWLQVEGGVLWLPLDGIEIHAGYSQVVLGANIAAIRAVSLTTAIRFDDLTAEGE